MKILILGGSGMVGSSIIRVLKKDSLFSFDSPSRKELNLFNFQK